MLQKIREVDFLKILLKNVKINKYPFDDEGSKSATSSICQCYKGKFVRLYSSKNDANFAH